MRRRPRTHRDAGAPHRGPGVARAGGRTRRDPRPRPAARPAPTTRTAPGPRPPDQPRILLTRPDRMRYAGKRIPLRPTPRSRTLGAAPMTTRTLRIGMNGITGRMGYRQHLVRSILSIRDQGGVTLEDGTRVQVEPILVGRNADKVRELAELHGVEHWTTDADCGDRGPDGRHLLRRPGDQPPVRGAHRGDEGRQAHLHGEADGRDAGGGDRPGAAAREHGRHRGRRARQALPARPGQAAPAGGRGLLRPDPVAARRVRLLGVRGRRPGGPAPQLELPQGGRRRHRRRHVLPLELRAGGHPRHGPDGERAGRHAHPDALGRAGAASTTPRPTTPRTGSSRSRRRAATPWSRRSTRRGRCACTATSWSSSRSTARTARRSRG